MTVFQMVEVAVPEKLFLLDAIENPSPGQGMRESAGLEFVNAVDEFDDEDTGQLSHDDGKTRGLEVTWRGQSAGTPQKPVKCLM